MSRSPDNYKGDRLEKLLSGIGDASNNGEEKATDNVGTMPTFDKAKLKLPPSPSHRKTQSLLSTLNPMNDAQRQRPGHRRHRSSFSEVLGSIKEDVVSEVQDLKKTWKKELEEGDRGHRYFLDMNMTRSLSVIPEDMSEFAHEARLSFADYDTMGLEGEPEAQPIPHTPVASLGSWLALLSAVFAVSSNGTALALLHDVHPSLKLFWRMTAVSCLLSYFAIRTMWERYREGGKFLPSLSPSQWVTFGSASLCFFVHTMLAFTALSLTSIGNAVIGTNSQALLLVVGKIFTGEGVEVMEGLGVLLAFGGCILCAGEESHVGENDGAITEEEAKAIHNKALLGDFMALGSAVFGVCYLTFAKTVRSHVSVTIFIFMVMLSGCILCFLSMTAMGVPYTFDNDPQTGLFGWVTLVNHHVFILLYIAIICNVVGTMGFVRAMEYFDNIIIAVATLLEPMIATLIAYALGVGSLPGTFGWIGNLLVAVGTLGVVYPSISKGESGGH